jgi:propionyl-CoA carboxylase alpha chain
MATPADGTPAGTSADGTAADDTSADGTDERERGRMIRKLLVANRGEIARRVFATARAMGITCVAVHSDADAHAPHVRYADEAVRLPGDTPAETYLRGDLLVAAALRAGADAVHPGYGFLSEQAGFARAVQEAGLIWVGPPPDAIAAMGSKVEAKALLAKAGVPMLPSWSEPDEVTDFPVLVKASAGGGGRGMRIVRTPAELPEALAAARREAQAAFGDGTVFCERFVETGRHIEVQVFGDTHGTVVALGERECSIQRRHQKIVEEAPSPGVGPELRAALCDAAVAAAEAVGYVGAGTVEFLLAPDGTFSFLEMNTRLQVEHPVTEAVYGLDLVRLQLMVAQGEPLPFTKAPPMRGHAIEVRLYAEDPAHGWMPSTGVLHQFVLTDAGYAFEPHALGIRLDAGVVSGSLVSVFYDPMLAKVIAAAPTRAEAALALAGALRRARLHGVVTNRDLLVRVLTSDEFDDGGTDTAFLDRHPEVFEPLLSTVEERARTVLAAALSGVDSGSALPAGWRNVFSQPQRVAFDAPWGRTEVGYRLDRNGSLAGWSVDGLDQPPTEATRAGDEVVLVTDGLRRAYTVHRVGGTSYVDGPAGSAGLVEVPRFPLPEADRPAGSLLAPMPGTVGRVLVAVGDRVAVDDVLVTLEAMKLEHAVRAPADGVVDQILVGPGDQVDTGALLAVVTQDERTDA